MTTEPRAAREAEARLKRLVVVGSLATFVGFFGLTIASDAIAEAISDPDEGNAIVIVRSSGGESVVVPHVRTRSS